MNLSDNAVIETLLLSGNDGMAQGVALLKKGQCVALPTETVYGLAADASNPCAVEKIFAAKGRPSNHPLIVHIPDVGHLDRWAVEIPPQAYQLAKAFWPGPLTLLLKKAPQVSNVVTGGLDTIGLRVPAHPEFLSLLKQLDGGLAAPSANRYKQLSPTSAEQVLQGLSGRIAAVLDGGECEHGLESTIVDVLGPTPRVLRAGPISCQQLEAVLGCEVDAPQHHVEVVPGNVKAHYQPNTPLQIATTEALLSGLLSEKTDCHFMLWSKQSREMASQLSEPVIHWTAISEDAALYGKALYGTLFAIDKTQAKKIIVEAPPTGDEWRAINDRLSRAATY